MRGHLSRLLAAAILSGCVSGVTGIGAAQAQDAQSVRYVDLTQAEQIGILRALVESGRFDEAQLLLNGSVFDEGDLGYQAAYLQAVIFRSTGQLDAASSLLRQILAERPEFRLVRLELAQVLAMAGQTDGAQFHLNILADAAEDAGEREFFEAAIDRMAPNGRLSFSTFLTIAPSTNLNSGAGEQTITLNIFGAPVPVSIGAAPESGIGVSYGGTAIYSVPVAEDRQLYLAGAAQVNDYPNASFDNQILTGRVGMHIGPTGRRTTLELVTDKRWVDGNGFDTSIGGRLAGQLSLGDGVRLDGEYTYVDRDFEASPSQITQRIEATYRKALNSRAGFSVGVITETLETLLDANSYDALGIEVGAYRGFENGFVLNGTAEFVRRDYRAVSAIVGDVRRDDVTRLRLSVLNSGLQFRGVTPRVSLTYTQSASNDVRFDYDAVGAELTLTSSF